MTDRIPTGCAAVDDLLGGGFERGAATQVYGPPAAGKTNIVLSAAVEVAADGGSALFVDTEGLSVERMEQLAAARAARPDTEAESVDELASRLVISAAHSFQEQEEAVQDAEELVDAVELVVLDSATGFYRLERTEGDEGETLRAVGRQLAHLVSLARQHDVAIAFTNQVFSDPEGDRSRALGGHTLDHWSGAILRVDRFRGGNRRATLEKHRARPAGESARFRITDEGLATTEGQ
ncbi:DNA repair and recombination protein RadB [Halobacteriales archaeon QH_7_68_42]|nr:MAG: DNA repair and recombination protein RadB [Halobacteriales archaeon QH_7_68_42]